MVFEGSISLALAHVPHFCHKRSWTKKNVCSTCHEVTPFSHRSVLHSQFRCACVFINPHIKMLGRRLCPCAREGASYFPILSSMEDLVSFDFTQLHWHSRWQLWLWTFGSPNEEKYQRQVVEDFHQTQTGLLGYWNSHYNGQPRFEFLTGLLIFSLACFRPHRKFCWSFGWVHQMQAPI